MVDVPITIACGNYDRTRAIRDGRVPVEAVPSPTCRSNPEEIFFRAFRYQEFDVSEIFYFSSYIRTVAAAPPPISAFRPSCRAIFAIPACMCAPMPASGRPPICAASAIGLPEYQITAVVWMRGLMQHEYGVKPYRDPMAQRWPGAARPPRAHTAQTDPGPRPAADRRRPDARRYAGEG